MDLTKLLQGADSVGGATLFSEISGSFSADATRLQLRQLRLAAGLLNAAGNLDRDGQGGLSGRVQAELRSQARASLVISGTLKEPQFRRGN